LTKVKYKKANRRKNEERHNAERPKRIHVRLEEPS